MKPGSKPQKRVASKKSATGQSASQKAFKLKKTPVTQPASKAPPPKKTGTPSSAPKSPRPSTKKRDPGAASITLLVRDPRWLFCYWDVDWSTTPANRQPVLRLLGPEGSHAIPIDRDTNNWHLEAPRPGATWQVDIGWFTPRGNWRRLALSNTVQTPSDAVSTDDWAEFATIPFHLGFQRLTELLESAMQEGIGLSQALARSAPGPEGETAPLPGPLPRWTPSQREALEALIGPELFQQIAAGSAHLDQAQQKKGDSVPHPGVAPSASGGSFPSGLPSSFHISSPGFQLRGGVSSWGPGVTSLSSGVGGSFNVSSGSWARAAGAGPERESFFHVNAEVIFYGGTHPRARVLIDDHEIPLQPDGTFRYHFVFPDDRHEIPIVAISPDGVEQRAAVLRLDRSTARHGQVDATAQPAHLTAPMGGKRQKD